MGENLQLTIAELDYVDKDSPIIEALNKYLMDTFCVYYDKGYKLYKNGNIYTLYLNMNNPDRPIITAGEFESDEAFTDYLIKDMRRRGLFRNEYFTKYRVDEDL